MSDPVLKVDGLTVEQWDGAFRVVAQDCGLVPCSSTDPTECRCRARTVALLGRRPEPEHVAIAGWSIDHTASSVALAVDEGRVWVAVSQVRHTEIDLSAEEAREMAVALVACADWIDKERAS